MCLFTYNYVIILVCIYSSTIVYVYGHMHIYVHLPVEKCFGGCPVNCTPCNLSALEFSPPICNKH